MGDSQGNNKGKGKEKEYESWTKEDSDELLHLMVDAIKNGLRDANGSLSKQNVERVVLPRLNAKARFPKTYNHYQSRMKWFKKQYNNMSTLMRNNSGFGWDPITKTFTASDEVWKEYLKSHPSHKSLRGKTMVDYEDLKIVVGGGTASGHNSMSVDPDDTDATTYLDENMEGFLYDHNNDAFIAPDHYEPPYQPPPPHPSNSPPQPPLGSEVPIEKPSRRKRTRTEYGGNSSSVGTNNIQPNALENLSVSIGTIAVNFEKMSNLMEKRERDREEKGNIWNAIKEIPNLDDRTRYMAADLLDTNAKKDLFLKMSIEERSNWINFKLG